MKTGSTRELGKLLGRAKEYARRMNYPELLPVHIFCSEIEYGKNSVLNEFLEDTETNPWIIKQELEYFLSASSREELKDADLPIGPEVTRLVVKTWKTAEARLQHEASVLHFTVFLIELLRKTLPEPVNGRNLMNDNWTTEVRNLKTLYRLDVTCGSENIQCPDPALPAESWP